MQADELRTIKLQFALSTDVDVFVIFNGPMPDAACFRRLHRLLELAQESMSGEKVNPCDKHPDAYRDPKSGRCRECGKELAARMNQKRADKKRELKAV